MITSAKGKVKEFYPEDSFPSVINKFMRVHTVLTKKTVCCIMY